MAEAAGECFGWESDCPSSPMRSGQGVVGILHEIPLPEAPVVVDQVVLSYTLISASTNSGLEWPLLP